MALGLVELLILGVGGMLCLLVPAGVAVAVIVSRKGKSEDAREGRGG